ncbi:MAG TPA: Ldh family oxidoreductase [Solirubrobacteraceae bacterium]|nr:Ldh family oxidoreductase [Solirubrobacteraceae bacterium]
MTTASVTLETEELRRLIAAAVARVGLHPDDAEPTVEHLFEAELRGRGGLERLFLIAEAAERHGVAECEPMAVVAETETTARLDGGGHVGYAVAARATAIAAEKAEAHGMAVVAADEHRHSGVLGLYVERLAREGLVAIASSTGTLLRVAPYGAREPRLATNPIAMAFPADEDPIVWDTATAALNGTGVRTLAASGGSLPEGAALDPHGRPTLDPAAVAAILPWGGHRGSGLAIVVQMLGLLAGLPVSSDGPGDWRAAFLLVAIDPGLLLDADDYRRAASELRAGIHALAPVPGATQARLPGERSAAERRRRLAEGVPLTAADWAQLRSLAGEGDERI